MHRHVQTDKHNEDADKAILNKIVFYKFRLARFTKDNPNTVSVMEACCDGLAGNLFLLLQKQMQVKNLATPFN